MQIQPIQINQNYYSLNFCRTNKICEKNKDLKPLQKVLPIAASALGVVVCYKNKKVIKNSFQKISEFFKKNSLEKTFCYSIRPKTKLLLEEKLMNIDLQDPRALKEAIESIPGTKIYETRFVPSPRYRSGRKFNIILNDGTKLILEIHTNKKGTKPILRLYDNILDKFARDYLHLDGLFHPDSYFSPDAHIALHPNDKTWMIA